MATKKENTTTNQPKLNAPANVVTLPGSNVTPQAAPQAAQAPAQAAPQEGTQAAPQAAPVAPPTPVVIKLLSPAELADKAAQDEEAAIEAAIAKMKADKEARIAKAREEASKSNTEAIVRSIRDSVGQGATLGALMNALCIGKPNVNPAMEGLLGLTLKELLGAPKAQRQSSAEGLSPEAVKAAQDGILELFARNRIGYIPEGIDRNTTGLHTRGQIGNYLAKEAKEQVEAPLVVDRAIANLIKEEIIGKAGESTRGTYYFLIKK